MLFSIPGGFVRCGSTHTHRCQDGMFECFNARTKPFGVRCELFGRFNLFNVGFKLVIVTGKLIEHARQDRILGLLGY